MFLARQPSPRLASHVQQLWYTEGYCVPHRKERVLPNGAFQMIIDLANGYIRQWDREPGTNCFELAPAALVVGMQSRYVVIDTAGLQSLMGAVFHPGGARAFFDLPADRFHNRSVALEVLWGSDAPRLVERLQEAPDPSARFAVLEAALLGRMDQRTGMHAAVRYALGELARAPHTRSIRELTREAGLSRRRFAQVFREQVGLTPKLYCRVHRFQQVLRQIAAGSPVDWADVAIAGGYCDQAHLGHEFHDFSGLSPGAYLAADRPFRNHVAID
jgi:AraC-like DNA-binding protein